MCASNVPTPARSTQLTLDVCKVLSHAVVVNLPSSLSGEEVGHEGAGRGAVGVGAQGQVLQDLMGLPAELPEARVVHDLALNLVDGDQALGGEDVVLSIPPSQKNELNAPVRVCLCVGTNVSARVVPAWGAPLCSGSLVSRVEVGTGFLGASPALRGAALGPRTAPQVGSVEMELLELLKDEPLQGLRGEVSEVPAVPPPRPKLGLEGQGKRVEALGGLVVTDLEGIVGDVNVQGWVVEEHDNSKHSGDGTAKEKDEAGAVRVGEYPANNIPEASRRQRNTQWPGSARAFTTQQSTLLPLP